MAVVCRHYGRVAAGLLRPRRRLGAVPILTTASVLHHPLGVVAVIAPWNYPLTLAISDALPALVAGNAVVLKPDTQTALTSLLAAELLAEVGLPDGLLQIVVGDGPVVGPALIERADCVTRAGAPACRRRPSARPERAHRRPRPPGHRPAVLRADGAERRDAGNGRLRRGDVRPGRQRVPVRGDEQAVRSANASAYGLNASVWTRDPARGVRVARRIEAGTVNVNDGYAAAWASVGAPMGGWKASGLGRRHGADGLLRYTEAQTVAVQRVVGFAAPPGIDAERWAGTLTAVLRAMKSLRLP